MKEIFIDSGPMIALFNRKDKYYDRAIEFIKLNKSLLITTEPNITETVFVLDFSIEAQTDYLKWIGRGAVQIISLTKEDLLRCAQLIIKYSNLPMDFADAAVVAISERLNINEIATIDKHFDIYRLRKNMRFKNVFF